MDQNRNMKVDRLAGAEAISARAIEIGRENGVAISKCIWDLGQDFTLLHAHRLDLFTETKNVRLYFPDVELTTTGNDSRKKRTEDRLHSAIAQLLLLPPSPTYTYGQSPLA
jgi:hypothetical protein